MNIVPFCVPLVFILALELEFIEPEVSNVLLSGHLMSLNRLYRKLKFQYLKEGNFLFFEKKQKEDRRYLNKILSFQLKLLCEYQSLSFSVKSEILYQGG
jgi:hypothetical protein